MVGDCALRITMDAGKHIMGPRIEPLDRPEVSFEAINAASAKLLQADVYREDRGRCGGFEANLPGRGLPPAAIAW
jgi:hypothetical protein